MQYSTNKETDYMTMDKGIVEEVPVEELSDDEDDEKYIMKSSIQMQIG